jgi:ketosteroid isomerase-like protein
MSKENVEDIRRSDQRNVELVARFFELVNEQQLDDALAIVDPGAVLDWSRSDAPDRGLYTGHEALRGWMLSRWEGLTGATFDARELIDAPPDKVVVVTNLRGTGRVSGMEIEALGAGVLEVRQGSLVRITLFQTKAEALQAAGLEG